VTTDDLTLILTILAGCVWLLVFYAVWRYKRYLNRHECPPDEYLPPASLEEWRRRAEQSQERSDARRPNRADRL
jgi:hypothetical protein